MMHFIKQLFDRLFGLKTYVACMTSLEQVTKSLNALAKQRLAEGAWAESECDRLEDVGILAMINAKRATTTANKIKELTA